jgi:organic radical activating enzyme
LNSERIYRPALEYPIVDHCNLSCANCDHSSPHLAEWFVEAAMFARDLALLARVLHADVLKLCGGEPFLHPNLLELLRLARESGIASKIELWTNGLLLHRIDPEVLKLASGVHVTVYPKIHIRANWEHLEDQCNTYGCKLDVEHTETFTKAVVHSRNDDPALVAAIFDDCKNTHDWSCHTVLRGKYYKCARAPSIHKILASEAEPRFLEDGIPLDQDDLKVKLWAYLNAHVPLAACKYCLGTSGLELPHRQLNKGELGEEVRLNIGDWRTLLRSDFSR